MTTIAPLPSAYLVSTNQTGTKADSAAWTGADDNFDKLPLAPRPSQPFLYPGDLHEAHLKGDLVLQGMTALAERN